MSLHRLLRKSTSQNVPIYLRLLKAENLQLQLDGCIARFSKPLRCQEMCKGFSLIVSLRILPQYMFCSLIIMPSHDFHISRTPLVSRIYIGSGSCRSKCISKLQSKYIWLGIEQVGLLRSKWVGWWVLRMAFWIRLLETLYQSVYHLCIY